MTSADNGKKICLLPTYIDTGVTTVNKSNNPLLNNILTSVNSITLSAKQITIFSFDGVSWIAGNYVDQTNQSVIYAGLSPAQSLFYGV